MKTNASFRWVLRCKRWSRSRTFSWIRLFNSLVSLLRFLCSMPIDLFNIWSLLFSSISSSLSLEFFFLLDLEPLNFFAILGNFAKLKYCKQRQIFNCVANFVLILNCCCVLIGILHIFVIECTQPFVLPLPSRPQLIRLRFLQVEGRKRK